MQKTAYEMRSSDWSSVVCSSDLGRRRLMKFVEEILPDYESDRNKPDRDGSSRLSAYLHFGYLSPLEIALAVRNADAPQGSKDAFRSEERRVGTESVSTCRSRWSP